MPRATYYIDDPMGRNTVLALSEAPLETVLLHATDVRGELALDAEDITREPAARLALVLDGLDTGSLLMNENLRTARWLDTAAHPEASFTLSRLVAPAAPTALVPEREQAFEAEGVLALHGAAVPCHVSGTLVWLPRSARTARRLPGDLLHVRGRFAVELARFGIAAQEHPDTADKVAGTIRVRVDLFLGSERLVLSERTRADLERARREHGARLLG